MEEQAHVNPRPVNDTLCQTEHDNFVYRNQQVS